MMKININIYNEILEEVLKSSTTFEGVSAEVRDELKEDFDTIIEDLDITKHTLTYTGGISKSTLDLLSELKTQTQKRISRGVQNQLL